MQWQCHCPVQLPAGDSIAQRPWPSSNSPCQTTQGHTMSLGALLLSCCGLPVSRLHCVLLMHRFVWGKGTVYGLCMLLILRLKPLVLPHFASIQNWFICLLLITYSRNLKKKIGCSISTSMKQWPDNRNYHESWCCFWRIFWSSKTGRRLSHATRCFTTSNSRGWWWGRFTPTGTEGCPSDSKHGFKVTVDTVRSIFFAEKSLNQWLHWIYGRCFIILAVCQFNLHSSVVIIEDLGFSTLDPNLVAGEWTQVWISCIP